MSMKPSVKDAYEFLEIMNDFTDPREVIREAISNSYDAEAKKLEIEIIRFQESGNPELKIIIKDDGEGMIGEPQNSDEKKIPNIMAFFSLGDSTRRSYDPTTWEKKSAGIGTKGHGAKIFYKSKVVEVETYRSNNKTTALVREPLKHFYKGELPEIDIKTTTCNPPD
jgi:hypothetical protein